MGIEQSAELRKSRRLPTGQPLKKEPQPFVFAVRMDDESNTDGEMSMSILGRALELYDMYSSLSSFTSGE